MGIENIDSKLNNVLEGQKGLKEVVIDIIKENIQQQALQVQPTYGTFPSSSKK